MPAIRSTILWTGIDYVSLENCMVETTPQHIHVDSIIVGLYEGKMYRVKYDIALESNWTTRSCLIESTINHEFKKTYVLKEGNNWRLNGEIHPELNGCVDIDISLTPLTNSLPINRLKITIGAEVTADIIYIDLLEGRVNPVKQKYTRISTDTFKYENVPNDFEALIKVDAEGFVMDYPGLFKRPMKQKFSDAF